MAIMKRTGVYAICPRCGSRRELDGLPGADQPWPLCTDCDEMMNVFVPRWLYGRRRVLEAAA